MIVGPVLVTVDPAKITKLAADFKSTGDWHATAEVVKFQVKLLASPTPRRSWAPVVMVAVYIVLSARGADGVKVAVLLGTS
jgi:hypothetical protein